MNLLPVQLTGLVAGDIRVRLVLDGNGVEVDAVVFFMLNT